MATRYQADFEGVDDATQHVFEELMQKLEADAQDRVNCRAITEDRWLTDIAYFEGEDDPEIIRKQRERGRSTATVNLIRAKCNTFESKLYDTLFPTDDRNWGVEPTPVPQMDAEASQLEAGIAERTEQANVAPDDAEAEEAAQEADRFARQLAVIEKTRQDASARSAQMQLEIEDNLVECDFGAECRKVIHDATVAGCGFLKGPLPLSERIRSVWHKEDGGQWRLKQERENRDRFVFQHVSYWHVFPNKGARDWNNVESWMERHIMYPRDLRDFARQPGVRRDVVRELLRRGPQDAVPSQFQNLDYISGGERAADEDKMAYVVWEYRGPLDPDDMASLVEIMAAELAADKQGGGGDPIEVDMDPLMKVDAVIYFCQGKLLKAGIELMDDGSPLYNIFELERSQTRLWKVGLPYLMRDQQQILNDTWRNMLDNASFAALPITEIDTAILQSVGQDDFRLYPGALLDRRSYSGDKPGIIFHDVPIHQEYYAGIIELAMQFIDTETNLSMLASGEQGTATRTAGGMSILMSNVNIVFRRVVKHWDDGITQPAISKAYHFLMQFSDKEGIKGDYAVRARGSSVLLVREVQQQNFLLLAQQAAVNPQIGQYLKMHPLLKKVLQSMLIPTEDVLLSEKEVETMQRQQAEEAANAPPDPAIVKLQVEEQLAQLDAEVRMAIARMQQEGDAAKAQMQAETAMQDIAAKIQAIREGNESRERITAAETAVKSQQEGAY